jgi:hypothetical protein
MQMPPLRTLDQVRGTLARDKARAKGKNAGLDISMARLMLKAGRLTPEARDYVIAYLAETNHDN